MAKAAERAPEGAEYDAYRRAARAFSVVAAAVPREQELDPILLLVANEVCALLELSRCSIFLRADEGPLYVGAVGNSEVQRVIKDIVSGTEADRFSRQIIETRKPVLIEDARSDPRVIRERMVEWGVRTMLGVPMIVGGEVLGLMYVDNADVPYDFTPARQELAIAFADLAAVAVSHAQLLAELRSQVQLAEGQNRLLRQAAAMEERIAELVLGGADLDRIVAGAAELTGRPCAIYDTGFEHLASAGPENGHWAPRLMAPDMAGNPEVRALIERRATQPPSIIGAQLHRDMRLRVLLAPVTTRGEVLGYLLLEERGGPFSGIDRAIAARIATVAALEIAAARRAATTRRGALSSLAADLLRGSADPLAASDRVAALGFRLGEPHVACMFVVSGATPSPTADELRAAFAEEGSAAEIAVTSVSEGTIALVPHNDQQLCGAVVRRLGGTARGSISGVCAAAPDYARAYEELGQLARAHRALGPAGPDVLSAGELGPARMLLAGGDPIAVDGFIEEVLGKLDPDRRNVGEELLATLESYFEHGQSASRAAAALGVHENTVRYRIRRIQTLLGTDISDAGSLMTIPLALMVWRLRGNRPSGNREAAVDDE